MATLAAGYRQVSEIPEPARPPDLGGELPPADLELWPPTLGAAQPEAEPESCPEALDLADSESAPEEELTLESDLSAVDCPR